MEQDSDPSPTPVGSQATTKGPEFMTEDQEVDQFFIIRVIHKVLQTARKLAKLYEWCLFTASETYKAIWQGTYKVLRLQTHTFSPYHLGAATPEREITIGLHIHMWLLYITHLMHNMIQRRVSSLCQWIVCGWFALPWAATIYPLPPYPGTRTLSKKWLETIMKRKGLMDSWSRIKSIEMEQLDQPNEMITFDPSYLRVVRIRISYHDETNNPIRSLILRSSKSRLYRVISRDYLGNGPWTEPMFVRHPLARLFDGPTFPREKFKTGQGFMNGVLWSFYWPWGDHITLTQDPAATSYQIPLARIPSEKSLKSAMITLARLHSIAWNDREYLTKCDWLTDWDLFQGEGQVRWESLLAHIRRQWSSSRKSRHTWLDKEGKRLIPTYIEAFIDESLSLSSWHGLCDLLRKSPMCMRHNSISTRSCSLVDLSSIDFSPKTSLSKSSEYEVDTSRPVTQGSVLKQAVEDASMKWDVTHRVRLDDWRRVGIGSPGPDIAAAILMYPGTSYWKEAVQGDTLYQCYLSTLKECVGSVHHLKRMDGRVYSIDEMRRDTIHSGIEILMMSLIREVSHRMQLRCNDNKSANNLQLLVSRLTDWYKLFMIDRDHVIISRGY